MLKGQTKGVMSMQHSIVSYYDASSVMNSAIVYYDIDGRCFFLIYFKVQPKGKGTMLYISQ